MANVFKYLDYKEFLKQEISDRAEKRGFITRLAEAAGCQRAYLSQVIHSHVQLTPEHACNISLFLEMNDLESDYFLLLVDHGRAGTPLLRQRLSLRMEAIRQKSENLAERFQSASLISPEEQNRYYSAWLWSAIHMLVSAPAFQTVEVIMLRLGVPRSQVLEILSGLESMGLVEHQKGRWTFRGGNLHVPRGSPLNSMNHLNWRMRAIQDAQTPDSDGVHYTAAFTMSVKDAETLKAKILAFFDDHRKAVGESGSEELYCFNCDFFKP